MSDRAVQPLLDEIGTRLGDRATWPRWPGDWQDDIESALIDAVFSARAVYETKNGLGIRPQVVRWQSGRARSHFKLSSLMDEIDAYGVHEWARQFGNQQRSPGRPMNAEGGPSKAATVREAADRLTSSSQIDDAASVTEARLGLVRSNLRTVPGIGLATSEYFLMLLGWPGVKPDRMIHRFLRRSYGHDIQPAEAKSVVIAAARLIGGHRARSRPCDLVLRERCSCTGKQLTDPRRHRG